MSTLLGLVGWRLHAGIQNPVLVHDLLHQFLLLPAKLVQLVSEGRQESQTKQPEREMKGRSNRGSVSRVHYQHTR